MAEHDEWAAPLPSSWADRGRALLPVVVLAGVALLGVRNHLDHDQTSWEGASFGMFATYDNHVTRQVVVSLVGPDGSTRAALPPSLEDDALRLRVAPSEAAARRLAAEVARLVLGGPVTLVVVELWRVDLDQDPSLTMRFESMLRATATP